MSRSKTTVLTGALGDGLTTKKERTPYRLHRQYSDRKPTNSYLTSARTRPELGLYSSGANGALPKSNYYDSPSMRRKEYYDPTARHKDSSSTRHKDSLYDPTSRRKDSLYDTSARQRDYLNDTSRYKEPLYNSSSTRQKDYLGDSSARHKDYLNDTSARHKDSLYDPYTGAYGSAYSNPYSSRLPATSTAGSRYNDYDYLGAYGSYEGRDREKENLYKSKYDPSRLYAEINNNDTTFARESNRSKRPQKGYRRTATANDLRPSASYRDYLDDDLPSTSSASTADRYAPRTSINNRKSQTQMFFDSENANSVRDIDDNNNNLYSDEVKSEAAKQREARRKEIQNLIAKYAQIDDVYNRAIDNKPVTDDLDDLTNTTATVTTKPLRENKALDLDLYGSAATAQAMALRQNAHAPNTFLPLAKTQSTSAMSSLNRSRIPKTHTTFVRTLRFNSFVYYY